MPVPPRAQHLRGGIACEFIGEESSTITLKLAQFGFMRAMVSGEAAGRYRIGGDVAFVDAEGVSALSEADFALAIVDEKERSSRRRAHLSVAY